MLVLNATTKVKSVMTDRGDLIQIGPGEFSRIIIASRNIIISAMNLGSPSEIGIVVTGSYEMDIAKTITGCVPYLYTDQDEAKAKLLKADVDYKGNLNASKVNAVNQELIAKKDKEIEELNNQILTLKSELAAKKDTDQVKIGLEKQIESLTKNLKTITAERDRLDTQSKDYEDQIASLTATVSDLRKSNGELTQDLTGAQKMITDLTEKLDNQDAEATKIAVKDLAEKNQELEAVTNELMELRKINSDLTEEHNKDLEAIESYKTQIDSWKTASDGKDKQIKDLSSALSEASNTIDAMKASFNEACSKFGITKDEDGNWIQIGTED